MSIPNRATGESEQVVLQTGIHWSIFLRAFCYMFGAVFLLYFTSGGSGSVTLAQKAAASNGFLAEAYALASEAIRQVDSLVFMAVGQPAGVAVSWVVFLYAMWLFIKAAVRYYATAYLITTRRVARSSGFYERSIDDTFLEQIEKINVRQNFSQRLFGHGLLVAVGTGGTPLFLDHVPDPMDVRQAIYQQMRRRERMLTARPQQQSVQVRPEERQEPSSFSGKEDPEKREHSKANPPGNSEKEKVRRPSGVPPSKMP